MKPAPFDYCRPGDMQEVLDLLARHGPEARILAGGQSMMAMLNMRVATPKILIDISALQSMDYIREAGDHIAVGCATRQVTLERWPGLHQKLPLIAKALPWVGHVQTRSRGTVCGSIAHADPSSELPLCLVLLGGQVVLRSRRKSRVMTAGDFFLGALQTIRRDDEVIEEVRLPVLPEATGVAFQEMAIRHGDFAIVAAGAIADADGVSIAFGGGADYPITKRLPLLEGEALKAALNALAWSFEFQDDLHATAAYRRHLVRMLGQKTIKEAVACRS
ncbi:MAG: FAD binding domain-containing protein [Hyphomicrobiaceae bacterium]